MANKIPKLTESGEVMGETTITEAKVNGWLRKIARVFVFDTEGRLLLQKRSELVSSFPGLWDQSAGGHVDVGETDIEAAVRETKEELGLNLNVAEIATDHKTDDPKDRVISSIYKAVVATGIAPEIDTEEVAEIRWISIEDFEEEIAATPESFVPTFVALWREYRDKLLA